MFRAFLEGMLKADDEVDYIAKRYKGIKASKAAFPMLIQILEAELKHIDIEELYESHGDTKTDCSTYKHNGNTCLAWLIALNINKLYGPSQMNSSCKAWVQYRKLLINTYGDSIRDLVKGAPWMYNHNGDVWAFRSPYTRTVNTSSSSVLSTKLKTNQHLSIEQLNNRLSLLTGGVADSAILFLIATGLRVCELHSGTEIKKLTNTLMHCTGIKKKAKDDNDGVRPYILYPFDIIVQCMETCREEDLTCNALEKRITKRMSDLFDAGMTPHILRGLYANISYMTAPQADTKIEHIRIVLNHVSVASSLHYNKIHLV